MVANDFSVRNALIAGATDKMLRLEGRIAEHSGIGHHSDVIVGRHCLPDLVEEGAVINLRGAVSGLA